MFKMITLSKHTVVGSASRGIPMKGRQNDAIPLLVLSPENVRECNEWQVF